MIQSPPIRWAPVGTVPRKMPLLVMAGSVPIRLRSTRRTGRPDMWCWLWEDGSTYPEDPRDLAR